jgi:hypothetical protein
VGAKIDKQKWLKRRTGVEKQSPSQYNERQRIKESLRKRCVGLLAKGLDALTPQGIES